MQFIDRLERQKKSLVKEAFGLAFYYRGGCPYETVMWMTAYERSIGAEWHHEYLESEFNNRPMTPNY
jgi:hypothetical protein